MVEVDLQQMDVHLVAQVAQVVIDMLHQYLFRLNVLLLQLEAEEQVELQVLQQSVLQEVIQYSDQSLLMVVEVEVEYTLIQVVPDKQEQLEDQVVVALKVIQTTLLKSLYQVEQQVQPQVLHKELLEGMEYKMLVVVEVALVAQVIQVLHADIPHIQAQLA